MSASTFSPAAARDAVQRVRGDAPADEEVVARALWSLMTEPGDGVAGRVVSALGARTAAEQALFGTAPALAGVAPVELAAARARWRPRLQSAQHALGDALERARRCGARLVVPGDAEWPARVEDLGEHAPHALWMRGDVDGLDAQPAVALVGARAASGYGEHVAAELGAEVGASGVTIVSGAAYGIDGAAHRGALASGSRTIALLAGGVDRPYPAGHAELIGRIAAHGAVIAETPCGTAPSKWRFLARNRLIAALSDATVVVEAGVRSGSLNTAAHAASLGRALGAVPGPVTSAASAGCHRILREFDGTCVTGPDDVREMLGWDRSAAGGGERGPSREMQRLLDAASTRAARGADELAQRSGLAVADVQALVGLAVLEGTLLSGEHGWRRAASR
ncbi:DNA-processing protein DprA [Microbacterium sp. NPDC091313]